MSFWNFIGEFFLFRWLFDPHGRNAARLDTTILSGSADINELDSHIGFGRHYDSSYSRYDGQDYGYSQSYDDFHNQQDDYYMTDDDF